MTPMSAIIRTLEFERRLEFGIAAALRESIMCSSARKIARKWAPVSVMESPTAEVIPFRRRRA